MCRLGRRWRSRVGVPTTVAFKDSAEHPAFLVRLRLPKVMVFDRVRT
jgi:hypothetical protein